MKEVLYFDVHNFGFIAVPYIVLTIVSIVTGFVADLFIGTPCCRCHLAIAAERLTNGLSSPERQWLSTTAVRKLCQAAGFTIAGILHTAAPQSNDKHCGWRCLTAHRSWLGGRRLCQLGGNGSSPYEQSLALPLASPARATK
jgi:hypothetical protein